MRKESLKRVECEKCLNSHFEDEKLRCRLKHCQPDYEDMWEAREALLNAFPNSFINEQNEFIAHKQANEYISLNDCEYPEDIDCKVLEWLSRAASKSMWYSTRWRNERFRKFMQDGINDYLDTNFSRDDFEKIYIALGNAINHELTKKFVKSGYNLDLLK